MPPISAISCCTAECPLLAQSGHPHHTRRCPLLGVKRTLIGHGLMSAFDPKRTSHWDTKSYSGGRRSALRSDSECSLAPTETLDKFPLIASGSRVGGLGDDDPAQFTPELGGHCRAC